MRRFLPPRPFPELNAIEARNAIIFPFVNWCLLKESVDYPV